MDIQDMAAAMAQKNENFHGTVQNEEKAEIFHTVHEHAAAVAKALRTPMHTEGLELHEGCASVSVDFPLPMGLLNENIRRRISEMTKLCDMVTYADVNCRLRMTFTVANVWKEE